jgi:hypothetical protein
MLNRYISTVVAVVLVASATVACGALLDIQNPNGHLTDAPADADIDSFPPDAAPDEETPASPDAPLQSDGGCRSSPSSWLPNSLSNLVLWLDAEDLGLTPGNAVASWRDRSSAHNDAVQSNVKFQPVLELSAIGGRPAVRFDGSMTFLSIVDSPTLQWGTADYVILVVARFGVTLGAANQALFEKQINSEPYPGPALFVNASLPTEAVEGKAMAMNSGDVYTASNRTGLNDAPHLFGTRRSGGMLEVRVDGAPSGVAVGSSLDVSAPGMSVSIGQQGYNQQQGFQALKGDIAEEIAVEGALSDSDLHTLECYLLGKYGI